MNQDSGNDDEWVARIQSDDEGSLVLLMRKYYVHLCQFSYSLLGHHELAQEAVSNVFVSLWRRRHALEIRASVRNYLFSAVANQSSNLLTSDVLRVDLVPLDDVPQHKLVNREQADSELLYRELQDEIDTLLATMPKQRQLVFKMNRIENMRYKEIGTVLGISEHTVRNHMAKAIQQLEPALPRLRNLLQRGSSPTK